MATDSPPAAKSVCTSRSNLVRTDLRAKPALRFWLCFWKGRRLTSTSPSPVSPLTISGSWATSGFRRVALRPPLQVRLSSLEVLRDLFPGPSRIASRICSFLTRPSNFPRSLSTSQPMSRATAFANLLAATKRGAVRESCARRTANRLADAERQKLHHNALLLIKQPVPQFVGVIRNQLQQSLTDLCQPRFGGAVLYTLRVSLKVTTAILAC